MKIQNNLPLNIANRPENQKNITDDKNFARMLAKELGQDNSASAAQLSVIQKGLGLSGIEGLTANAEETNLLASLLGQTENLLGDFENYASILGSGDDKTAWSVLSGLESRIKNLRSEAPGLGSLGEQGQGLDSVLNELEIIAATEAFKFNRGDYL